MLPKAVSDLLDLLVLGRASRPLHNLPNAFQGHRISFFVFLLSSLAVLALANFGAGVVSSDQVDRIYWTLIPQGFSFAVREAYLRQSTRFQSRKAEIIHTLNVLEQQRQTNRERDNTLRRTSTLMNREADEDYEEDNSFLESPILVDMMRSHLNTLLFTVFGCLFLSTLPFGFQLKVVLETFWETIYSSKRDVSIVVVLAAFLHVASLGELLVRLRIFSSFAMAYVDSQIVPLAPPAIAG